MSDPATTIVPPAWGPDECAHDGNPHRQLMAAVLQTAVDDCWDSFSPRSAGYGTLGAHRRFRHARIYVLSKDRVWPFSFENLCDAFDVDAHKLRRRLLRAPASTTRARPAPVTIETDARLVVGVASLPRLKFTDSVRRALGCGHDSSSG